MYRFALTLSLLIAITAAAATVAYPASAEAAQGVRLRRFALVVGANDGGQERTRLRYAASDARAFAHVVRELGGVDSADVAMIVEPDADALERAFAAMKRDMAQLRDRPHRVEFLLYYSGHSDEKGLLLGGRHYSYAALREQIHAMPADVHIAILDSCSSGAFTRTKGGVRRPAFLVDDATQVRGHAFLSSSSADEAAQESDRIRASFFTHYLVSGLRGGADANRDGRVTLNEAYQFAFNETVTRTGGTRFGAQHPAYDMHLVGSGDIVMTDLRRVSASLVMSDALHGRLFIRDQGGHLVVELQKAAGAPMLIGIGAGRYRVTLEQGARRLGADIELRDGRQTVLTPAQFHTMHAEATVARGTAVDAQADGGAADGAVRTVPASISLVPGVALGTGWQRGIRNHASLNVLIGSGTALRGVEIGGLGNLRSGAVEGVQIAGLGNLNAGETRGWQVGGVANLNDDATSGWQVGGVFNWNHGEFRGWQTGGVFNRNRGAFSGWQLGGAANWNRGALTGVQTAGVVNVSEDRVRGAQIAVLNIGADVTGTQIGVVNIARSVRGSQIGVVNVADTYAAGGPFGPLNFVRDGYRRVELWSSDMALANLGVKLGSKHVYGLITASSGSLGDDEQYALGIGVGTHQPLSERLYLDVDLATHNIFGERGSPLDETLWQLRAAAGYDFGPLSAFAGASLGVFSPDVDAPLLERPLLWNIVGDGDSDGAAGDIRLQLVPGAFAGVAY